MHVRDSRVWPYLNQNSVEGSLQSLLDMGCVCTSSAGSSYFAAARKQDTHRCIQLYGFDINRMSRYPGFRNVL